MPYTDQDRLIALAGIFQAAHCVRQIARKGTVDTDTMEPCIYSLFQTDAESTEAVYGAAGGLAPGARELISQLTGKQGRDLELTRHVITLLKLERVLAGRRVLMGKIAGGIEQAAAKLDHLPLLHPSLLADLAEIYSGSVSNLHPRILVRGEPVYLQNPDNQNRIRALLLAGIRAAWLWRQVGGSRWKILFGRRRLLDSANRYLRRSLH
jgi:high frequency lysogenization protein